MVSSASIQEYYIDLYKVLREYLWSFDTVQDIVNLELDSFQALPDIHIIYLDLNKLKQDCTHELGSLDDSMNDSMDLFYSVLDEDPNVYCKLYCVQEV